MTTERSGLVTLEGNPFTLLGNPVAKGDKAPDFTVLTNELAPRSLADYKGKVLIISSVPSLDTGVCDVQTRRFNAEAVKLGKNVRIVTISCDLPFAQARWCGAAGIDGADTLSDHFDLSFGLAYGLVLKELRLLTRAVHVVDANGRIVYQQIVPEVTSEPDYEAALAAAKAVV